MMRKILLFIFIVNVAFALKYITVKSGLWNDETVWNVGSGYPSANYDTAVIRPAHFCTLNVDLSGLSTGLGAIIDSGTLFI